MRNLKGTTVEGSVVVRRPAVRRRAAPPAEAAQVRVLEMLCALRLPLRTRVVTRCMSGEPTAKQARFTPMESLRVKRLTEHATLPVRGSAGAAGYDLARRVAVFYVQAGSVRSANLSRCLLPAIPPRLASAYDFVVPARGKELVKTDLSIAIPEGTYARIAPRSGLAWKNFIDTGAGVRAWLPRRRSGCRG